MDWCHIADMKQILPKNVGDLGKLIVTKGFIKLPKSPINRPIWSHCSLHNLSRLNECRQARKRIPNGRECHTDRGESSVTRWLGCFVNIWPFATMKISPNYHKFAKVGTAFFEIG